jgi:hypothetical protein
MESLLEKTLCCDGSDTGTNWFQLAGMLVVTFTSALVATIGIFGIYPVLYDAAPSPLWYAVTTAIAVLLEANIFFNYYGAVFKTAGAVQEFYDLAEVPPSRNSFDNFTYCEKCVSVALHVYIVLTCHHEQTDSCCGLPQAISVFTT